MVLPLAFPAYVLAYAYTHVLDHPGIVQTTLRDVTGWGPRDYWFPEIRSLGGAAVMLILCFTLMSTCWRAPRSCSKAARPFWPRAPWAAARGRRSSRSACRWRGLPLRAACLLAVMETIADFGTVAYFGVQTFATGIYTSWFSLFDRAGPRNWRCAC